MKRNNRDYKGELDSIRGELRNLQVIKLGGQEYVFTGTREEFIDFLKQSMLDKLVKLDSKWVYSRGDDSTLSKRMHYLGDTDDTGIDLSIEFKTLEIFDRECMTRAAKIVDDYESFKAGKKKDKKKEFTVDDLPF